MNITLIKILMTLGFLVTSSAGWAQNQEEAGHNKVYDAYSTKGAGQNRDDSTGRRIEAGGGECTDGTCISNIDPKGMGQHETAKQSENFIPKDFGTPAATDTKKQEGTK